jgi:hypothetical protein
MHQRGSPVAALIGVAVTLVAVAAPFAAGTRAG